MPLPTMTSSASHASSWPAIDSLSTPFIERTFAARAINESSSL